MSQKGQYEIRKRLERLLKKAGGEEAWEGIVGDAAGTITVPGQSDLRYVRPVGSGLPVVVHRGAAPDLKGLHVKIGRWYKGDRQRILGTAEGGGSASKVEAHGSSHGPEGEDPVYIADWQILPLLVYATTGMNVHVNSGEMTYQGKPFRLKADDISLTGSIPGSGARYSLIRASSTGVLDVQDGTPVDSYADLTDDDIPVCETGYAAIAYARLYYGQTALSKLTTNPDVRMLVWGNGLFDISGFSGFDDAEGDPIDVDYTVTADGTSVYASRRDHRHHLGDHEHVEADITDLSEHDAIKIKGKEVNAPEAGDDQKALIYDHALSKFIYGEAGGGGEGGGDLYWYVDGALSAAENVGQSIVAPYDMEISKVIIHVKGTGSSGSTIVDVNLDGMSIFASEPEIAWDDPDGIVIIVPDTWDIDEGETITVDIDQAAVGAESLTVAVIVNSKGTSVTKFIDLYDTPGSYTDQATKVVAVNEDEDSLEFIDRVDPFSGARYNSNAAQNIVNNATVAIVDFEDQVYDTGSLVTVGAAWKFTAPATPAIQYYHIDCSIMFAGSTGWAAAERGLLQLFKNNALLISLDRKDNFVSGSSSLIMVLKGSVTIKLSANDFIDIRVAQNSGGNIALSNDPASVWVNIERVG